jgi:peptidoglycan/xylan/chitin deacetylase (PgdA/CDA1 family)
MRLDRSLTMLVSFLPRRPRMRVPVLMYHSISEKRLQVSHRYFETSTPPPVFRRHMQLLRDAGYSVVKLDAIGSALSSMVAARNRFAAISFDDGYEDFYSNAFPVLQSFGYPSTMFLPTAFIGRPGPGLEGRGHLNWGQVRELHAAGIEFGSHTVNHLQLAAAPEKEIPAQIIDSKAAIEQRIGGSVAGFAYPLRFPEENRRLVALIRNTLISSGYRYGVCTSIGNVGTKDDRFFMKRLPVNAFDDDAFFLAKLSGAYDWLHGPQLLKKRIMPWIHR